MTKSKEKMFAYRWQFVAPTFTGWPDGRPWTRVGPGPFARGPMPEGPDGPSHTMPANVIEDIAVYLDDLARTFEMQGNHDEAPWHRARTRTAERSMLVRVRIPDAAADQPPAEMPA